MRLYDLGEVPWLESQLIYHALPRLGMEGLVLLLPASPYVCIGYHQDAGQEVDLAYCREHDIPVFRREVGGGAVYLDGDQLFYQLVIRKDNPLVPAGKEAFYRKFLEPVAKAYTAMGIPARYRPINDVVTAEGRKISGTGAAEMGDCLVLVGNIIMDFDYQTMVRVLKVPDEKFRDKVFKSLRQSLTTIRGELGAVPPLGKIKEVLVRSFEGVLGPLERAELPPQVHAKVRELIPRLTSEEWLHGVSRRREGRRVKVATGVEVVQGVHKAPGGLIRATVVVEGGRLADVSLSGDFFFYPAEKLAELEETLVGIKLGDVERVIEDFYRRQEIESPGVSPGDFAKALTVRSFKRRQGG
ncbi:MAG TPA: lipoate--protein ligase family protein [Anaerolineae bacterium]|nr:lipoate--protein ligase family protein [Anaerolineae bacterium]